jgi:hypothetical protein
MKNNEKLFDIDPLWKEEWKDMPEFVQHDLQPLQSVTIHFANKEDRDCFAKLIGQNITSMTKSLWYPAHQKQSRKVYVDES